MLSEREPAGAREREKTLGSKLWMEEIFSRVLHRAFEIAARASPSQQGGYPPQQVSPGYAPQQLSPAALQMAQAQQQQQAELQLATYRQQVQQQ